MPSGSEASPSETIPNLMQAILFDLYEDFENLYRKTKSALLKLI